MRTQTENIPEQRLVKRLKSYWDMIGESGDVPFIHRFNGASIPDIWESCLLIKLGNNNGSKLYSIEHTGKQLHEAMGRDLRGKYFSPSGESGIFSKDFVQALNNSIEKKEFTLSEGTFINLKGRTVKYRDCVMPLKDNKGEINFLVVGISWRAF